MRRLPLAILAVLVLPSCAKQEKASVEYGREVVQGSLCVHCHGPELNGTPQGPPLQGLAEHWTEERLMRYLENPSAMIESDPRLQALANNYSAIMPRFITDERTRLSVAMYLLEERGGGE